MTVVRLLVCWLILATVVAGCTIAVRLQENGISIEWPKVPSIPLPF